MTWRRFLRGLVGILVAGSAAHYGDNVAFLTISPFLNAAGKWVRTKWPSTQSWLIF